MYKMEKLNTKNPEDMQKYRVLFFSEKGYVTLSNLLKNLVKECFLRETFPYQLPPLLGIPLFKYAMHINSYDELIGRIKILAQILAIEEIHFILEDGRNVTFKMTGEFLIN